MTRLEATIKFTDMTAQAPADKLWFDLDARVGGMFVDDTYDPFMLIGLYLAMYNHTDLTIRGNVSKKLYKNLSWYVPKILCDFSDKLSPAKISVEGFAPTAARGRLIGTGISCGVDSLSTLYDRFVKEDDPDYKVNALFLFNCGSHGDFTASHTQKVFRSRAERARAVADELNLPLIVMDTNIHHFRHEDDKTTLLYLAFYSCLLSLQNAIRRYYVPSSREYSEIKGPWHYDLAGFADSYLVPLMQTERTELIIDGCQYSRAEKIKRIADWDIARKYLNVCRVYDGGNRNCGTCPKCLRTLLVLEILGKLDDFADVFDLDAYRKAALNYKAENVRHAETDAFSKEITDLAKEYNFPMPTRRECYAVDRQVVIFDE